jgi:alpha-galactosidase
MRTGKRIYLGLAGIVALAFFCIVQASFAPAAFGAGRAGQQGAPSFTGKWRGPWTAPLTTYFLTQKGNTLSGAILIGGGLQDITDGSAHGNEASWIVTRKFRGQTRQIQYHATLANGELTVTTPGSRAPTVAKRVSPDGTPVSPYANLPKVKVPPLRKVSEGGVALTPPMGWNSWNHFHGSIDDAIVRQIADAMASDGMRDAGYVYVNIDDTWEGTRDANGNIRGNSKFPDMKSLADYVHSKGLKLGIYSSPGPLTCAGYAGSYGHEEQDAKTWASWGIDYVKYDWCSARQVYQAQDMRAVYQMMGEDLRATGRPIVFSLCQYGEQDVWKWGPLVGGNLWRTTGDIQDNWKRMSQLGFQLQTGLAKYAAPGHWNDPDMLEVGNGGMTDTEYKTHFSLWAMLAAPLIAGNDVRHMSNATKAILENKDVIAVDQDRLGKEGSPIAKSGETQVWAKPLEGGAYAIALFNLGETPARMSVKWSQVHLSGKLHVRDLWAHKNLGEVANGYSATVAPHGVAMIRVSR